MLFVAPKKVSEKDKLEDNIPLSFGKGKNGNIYINNTIIRQNLMQVWMAIEQFAI